PVLVTASAQFGLGQLAQEAGRFAEAEALYAEAAEALRAPAAGESEKGRSMLAAALHHRAVVCGRTGRRAEAGRDRGEAGGVRERPRAPGAGRPTACNWRWPARWRPTTGPTGRRRVGARRSSCCGKRRPTSRR